MRNNREYVICKDIAIYMRLQYPKVLFHFDLAGLNLSRAQAGMMKAIQGSRGWPDLFIAKLKYEDLGNNEAVVWQGLFIELKKEGEKIYRKNGIHFTPHIKEQSEMLFKLRESGYKADFGIGFDACKRLIDEYLK